MASRPLHDRQSLDMWVHTPTGLTLAWLAISIPLVIWDTGYVMLRPLTMPGGSLHWPVWVPYEIYMRTDFIYGWKAINEKNGFTAAQASMNIPETLLYIYYLYLVYTYNTRVSADREVVSAGVPTRRYLLGEPGALAVVVGFAAATMTFSKTFLYGLNEAFSGWSHVRQNEWTELIMYWIIPK
ncbi:MAG: hypothetical protein M1820_008953 [Bogoriella megaspora]|nr:MAG: hypothetical protein M1820_008953 [Bogoriella megaspora]